MDPARRKFIKNVTACTTGITLSSAFLLEGCAEKPAKPKFPFFEYANAYHIGEYMPKDQGGKFIQMQLMGSEDDEVIVEAIRNGLFQKVYGDPIGWGKLEKTELEKSVWLNRFYCLPSFARLYYLSGDQNYVDDMMQLVRQWIKDNPLVTDNPASKYNWYDMQVAWRSIHLSWCYYLAEKGLSSEDKKLIVDSLKEHAEILAEGFGNQKLNEFNHQVHGALAMLYLDVLFPQLPQAAELQEASMRILEHHIDHAFYRDGGNVEQMFGYYPFEASIFRDAHLLCAENGIDLPRNIRPLLQKMAQYLFKIAQPDGTMPPVNDSYPMPVNPTLKTIRELVDPKEVGKTVAGSCYFPDSQIGVMRSGAAVQNSWYLLANPAKTIGSHAHAGRLGFLAWLGKQPLFIESGCNSYDDPLLVKWYRTSRAHNTVIIDGQEDEAASSDIQWAAKRQTENQITDFVETEEYRLMRMASPATEKTNNSVHWIRTLALVKDEYLLIYDYFKAEESHEYEILFHFPPLLEVQHEEKDNTLLLKTDNLTAVIPADANFYNKLEISEGYVNVQTKDVLAPVVSYFTSGKETHSVLLVTPVKNSASEFRIKQENPEDGISLTIENAAGEKDIILFRKPGYPSFKFMEYENKRMKFPV